VSPRGYSRRDPSRALGEDDHLLGDTHDVGQFPSGQAVAEVLRDSIAGIGQDHPARQPLTPPLIEEF
jgi:hypothetical protein